MGYIHHVLIFVAYMLLNPILVNCDTYNITKVKCPQGSQYNPKACCLASLEAYTIDVIINGTTNDYDNQVKHGIYHLSVFPNGNKVLLNKTGEYSINSKKKCTYHSNTIIDIEQETKCKFSTGQKSMFKGCYTLGDDRRILEGWSDPGVKYSLMLLRRETTASPCFRVFDIIPGGVVYLGYDKIEKEDFYTDSFINGIFNDCV